MKTAVIYTGHMRTFDACFHSHQEKIFSQLREEPSFFVSTIADADAHKAGILQRRFRSVEVETVPSQPDCISELRRAGCNLPTRWVKGESYMHEKFPITAHPQAVARQLWQLRRGWQMLERSGEQFDRIIRIRPDILIHHCDALPQVSDSFAHVPWWGKFEGCNDRFAVLGRRAARAYFDTYSRTPEIIAAGGDLHPETLIRKSMEMDAAIYIDATFGAVFSSLRTDGEVRAPEISAADIYELAASALT